MNGSALLAPRARASPMPCRSQPCVGVRGGGRPQDHGQPPTRLCCSPEYARRARLPETIEALAHPACIGYANAPASHLWQFEPRKPAGEVRSTVTIYASILRRTIFRGRSVPSSITWSMRLGVSRSGNAS